MNFIKVILILFFAKMSHANSEINLGKKIATEGNGKGAVACLSCHGINGEGQSGAGFPALAGMNKVYLSKQLNDFKKDLRVNAVMKPMAMSLTDKEIIAVASYYASLKPNIVFKKDKSNELGQQIVEQGLWQKNVPSCISCHGKDLQGVGENFPSLLGQGRSYIVNQLKAWKNKQRKNDPNSLMKAVVDNLSDEEIEATAAYLSSEIYKTTWKPKKTTDSKLFQPPFEHELKEGKFAEMVKKGMHTFRDTPKYASKYMGNELRCANCHIDNGRKAWSAPLWAVFSMYPTYRKKNDKVNTLQERLQGCFIYSLNGKPPAPDSEIITSLVTYIYWLSQGTMVGKSEKGRGFPILAKPQLPPDYKRGEKVYTQHCAICHSQNGQGMRAKKDLIFPPLWGKQSYNWGAGMHRINTAAGFIKANMPLSKPNSLSDQQAWDVSYYINSQKRPQDPRFKGNSKTTAKKFHQHDCQYNK